MKNELNVKKKKNFGGEMKNKVKEDLSKIKKDYEKNIINYKNIYYLNSHLIEIKSARNNNNDNPSDIIDLFTLNYMFFFRILLIRERKLRLVIFKIFKNCIEINPGFTDKMIDAMIPIIIYRIFETNNNTSIDERYECLQLFKSWIASNDENFPIIFLQAIVSQSKSDEPIKIGCIELLRLISIQRTDLCSTVGGFKVLINAIIEQDIPKDLVKKIIYTLIYVINTINKRKYFNGFLQKVIFPLGI